MSRPDRLTKRGHLDSLDNEDEGRLSKAERCQGWSSGSAVLHAAGHHERGFHWR